MSANDMQQDAGTLPLQSAVLESELENELYETFLRTREVFKQNAPSWYDDGSREHVLLED